MGKNHVPQALKSIALMEFGEAGPAVNLSWPHVKTNFKELSRFASMIFQKPTETFDIHFHLEGDVCGTHLFDCVWDEGHYQDQIVENDGLLFAHFTRRRVLNPHRRSTIKDPRDMRNAIPSSPPYMKVSEGKLPEATVQNPGRSLLRRDSDHTEDTQMTDANHESTPEPVRRSESGATDATIAVDVSFHSGTSDAFERFRSSTLSLPATTTSEEIRRNVRGLVVRSFGASSKLPAFTEDIDFDVFLGTHPQSMIVLQEDKLLKDYVGLNDSTEARLVAQVHVYVCKNGERLERLDCATNLHNANHSQGGAVRPTDSEHTSDMRMLTKKVRRSFYSPLKWPDDVIEVTFYWKARTEGIPRSFKRFAVDLHETSTYEDIVTVVQDELRSMVSRSKALQPYSEDVRWELYMGATENSLKLLQEGTILKDYEDGIVEIPRTLVAHMHIRVTDKGEPLKRLENHSEYHKRKSVVGLRGCVGEMKQSPHSLVFAEVMHGNEIQLWQTSMIMGLGPELAGEDTPVAHKEIRYFAAFAKFEQDETKTKEWILERMRAGCCIKIK